MKRAWLGLAVLCVAALAAMLGVREIGAADPEGAPSFVRVARGSTLAGVSRELETRGLIRNARFLRGYARLTGRSRAVKAGRYRLSPRNSAPAILEALVRGETAPIRVVFPEGLWLREVASLLADSLGLDLDSVYAAATDGAFLAASDVPAESAEGYLAPDTYAFEGTESPREAVARLLDTSRARWTPARAESGVALGFSRHEAMTLASIIEAETALPSERRKVSAVYHRRLRRGMRLQADPTIVYALGVRGRAPTYGDLDVNSPYNTYRVKGLPPGPIGNPGESAIEAALDPDSTCTALFFVARTDGSHVFTDTFEAHVEARKAIRR